MFVKLLQDVMETDRDGNPTSLKVSLRKTRPTIAYVKGAIVEMSDSSGQKYIDRGWAEAYTPNEEPAKSA